MISLIDFFFCGLKQQQQRLATIKWENVFLPMEDVIKEMEIVTNCHDLQ